MKYELAGSVRNGESDVSAQYYILSRVKVKIEERRLSTHAKGKRFAVGFRASSRVLVCGACLCRRVFLDLEIVYNTM